MSVKCRSQASSPSAGAAAFAVCSRFVRPTRNTEAFCRSLDLHLRTNEEDGGRARGGAGRCGGRRPGREMPQRSVYFRLKVTTAFNGGLRAATRLLRVVKLFITLSLLTYSLLVLLLLLPIPPLRATRSPAGCPRLSFKPAPGLSARRSSSCRE